MISHRAILNLFLLAVLLSACRTDPARIEYVRKQAYELGAKLGDSTTTRLTERFEPATPVTGGDTYYVFFTVNDNQQEFESKLALLGKFRSTSSRSTEPSDALDSLAILGQTGAYTYTGVPLSSYAVWSVEGLDAFFYFYSIATHTGGKYTLNGKPIVDNVVCISVQRVQSATMPTAKP
jgi:hypothetical protein